jgi:hypothetical protein
MSYAQLTMIATLRGRRDMRAHGRNHALARGRGQRLEQIAIKLNLEPPI